MRLSRPINRQYLIEVEDRPFILSKKINVRQKKKLAQYSKISKKNCCNDESFSLLEKSNDYTRENFLYSNDSSSHETLLLVMAFVVSAAAYALLVLCHINGGEVGGVPGAVITSQEKVDAVINYVLNQDHLKSNGNEEGKIKKSGSTLQGLLNKSQNRKDEMNGNLISNGNDRLPSLQKNDEGTTNNAKVRRNAKTKVNEKKRLHVLSRQEEKHEFTRESWSFDGRIHCFEGTSEIITCHSHGDTEGDEDMGKNSNAESMPYSNPTERPSINKAKHSNALLYKNAQRKRPLMKLDLVGEYAKVINSVTGEEKPVKNLKESEEIDIDSLTSAAVSSKAKPFTAMPVMSKSIHELLTELQNMNYPDIETDEMEDIISQPWAKDKSCRRFATRFGRGFPEVDLVAYPRSGRRWLRYLLEGITGIFTASELSESWLIKEGFLGESEPVYSKRTLVQQSQSLSSTSGLLKQDKQGSRDYIPVILLFRNPAKAIVSHWQTRNCSNKEDFMRELQPKDFETQEFHDFVTQELNIWEQIYTKSLLWSRSLHVVHYEDLVKRPLVELLRILHFLQFPAPSAGRLFCLRQFLKGNLQSSRAEVDPYTTWEQDAIFAAVTRVSAVVNLRNFELPSYFIPLDEYPPERAHKEFSGLQNIQIVRMPEAGKEEL